MAAVAALPVPLPPMEYSARPRAARRRAQPTEVPAQAPLLRQSWGRGRVEASLKEEIDAATARGDIKHVKFAFPKSLQDGLQPGKALESFWASLKLPLGGGKVTLSLQLALLPTRLDEGEEAWHLVMRVRELSRIETAADLEKFWAVRLIAEIQPGIVAQVRDHRSTFPEFCETHTQRSFLADDAEIEALKVAGSVSVAMFAEVFDAKGPPAGSKVDRGDCC